MPKYTITFSEKCTIEKVVINVNLSIDEIMEGEYIDDYTGIIELPWDQIKNIENEK